MGYKSSEAKAFIERIAPIIVREANKRGYKIKSTVIAQAIIEGAAGTSKLAKNYHNHFGMKCGSSWNGKSVNLGTKEEYTAGTLTKIKANFRAYDSDEEGIAGYYDFIQSKRYANLKTAKNYTEYAQMLKKDGWATSSTYVNTLTSTVKKYNLDVYDSKEIPSGEPVVNYPTLKRGSTGEAVKYAQTLLNAKGYKLNCDGIFGPKTENAVKVFQSTNLSTCVTIDGIIGKKTWSALTK